jgi:hypothetical protein
MSSISFDFHGVNTPEEFARSIRGVINKRDIIFMQKTADYYAVAIPVRNMVTNPTVRLLKVPIEVMAAAKQGVEDDNS